LDTIFMLLNQIEIESPLINGKYVDVVQYVEFERDSLLLEIATQVYAKRQLNNFQMPNFQQHINNQTSNNNQTPNVHATSAPSNHSPKDNFDFEMEDV
jgi:hypothetical protein